MRAKVLLGQGFERDQEGMGDIFYPGDGGRMRFWKDIWCREEPLSTIFPVPFALVFNKDSLVADFWEASGDEGGPLISQEP